MTKPRQLTLGAANKPIWSRWYTAREAAFDDTRPDNDEAFYAWLFAKWRANEAPGVQFSGTRCRWRIDDPDL